MLKLQIIGHLGKDAIMQQHGTDNVLNFSIAHTDKFKNSAGVQTERTTWVDCSWWIDGRSTVGQYLKKGTLVWAEGLPATRMWEGRDGKSGCSLVLRIFSLQMLGGKREDNQNRSTQETTEVNQEGFKPVVDDGSDLPF